MSTIALAHFRVGETDGVGLEMDKIRHVLTEAGHEVFFIAGKPGAPDTEVIEEIAYDSGPVLDLHARCFEAGPDGTDARALRDELARLTAVITSRVVGILNRRSADAMMVHNMWSLGWMLSAGPAFAQAVRLTGVRAIAHHHDFHWERERYSRPSTDDVRRMLGAEYPPRDPAIRHLVINRIARDELMVRTGITADILPNVFDFDQPVWQRDAYNDDFREAIGVGVNDVLLLQATRVVERKGIELAIDLARRLIRDPRLRPGPLYDGRRLGTDDDVVLVMVGQVESPGYAAALEKRASAAGVRVVWASDRVAAERGTGPDGRKVFSLWDTYVHADLVTYPSLLEGWGNQFLEALFARKPIVVFEYPVYVSDLKQHAFTVASLGDRTLGTGPDGLQMADKARIEATADIALRFLTDAAFRKGATQENWTKARDLFGYDTLRRIVLPLFE